MFLDSYHTNGAHCRATTDSGRSTPYFDQIHSLSSFGFNTPSTSKSILFGEDNDVPEHPRPAAEDFVLIVGGLGFIGSHTAWELLKDGRSIIIVDNLSNSYITVLERLRALNDMHFEGRKGKPKIDFHNLDYRHQETMRHMLLQYQVSNADGISSSRIKAVIHFAAYKAVEESIRHPLKYYSNNVSGLVDFCTLLDSFFIKTLIFSSSATVYGELANQGGHLREELCVHKTINWIDSDGQERTTMSGSTGLTNPYGRTKWMCEAILSDLAVSDPEWKIFALRYFNPVGADSSGLLGEEPRGQPSNLMPVLVQTMMGERESLKVFGSDWDTKDGTCVRDFIHVSDLARGHIAALRKAMEDESFGGFHAVNLGTGCGSTVAEVVSAMEDTIGRSIPKEVVERRPGDVGVCVADTKKAEEMLGWRAQRTVNDSCRDIVGFLKLDYAC